MMPAVRLTGLPLACSVTTSAGEVLVTLKGAQGFVPCHSPTSHDLRIIKVACAVRTLTQLISHRSALGLAIVLHTLVFARPVESCATCALVASGSCLFSPRQLIAGAVLERQGEVATEVSFVKQGLLALSAIDAAGLEMLASVRGPRALIGLEGLHGRPARFTVTALMDSVVCTTAAAALSRDVELHRPSHPASALLDVVLDEPRQLSKRHVATLLGIRPETMSRCLKALADEGLIADDRIEVLDPEGLDDVAHGARS